MNSVMNPVLFGRKEYINTPDQKLGMEAALDRATYWLLYGKTVNIEPPLRADEFWTVNTGADAMAYDPCLDARSPSATPLAPEVAKEKLAEYKRTSLIA